MTLMEPGVCRVDVARGELTGATNRYVKTLADLEGLYADAAAFEALKRELGDEVVYEVTDFKPSANAADMIIGVTKTRPGGSLLPQGEDVARSATDEGRREAPRSRWRPLSSSVANEGGRNPHPAAPAARPPSPRGRRGRHTIL